MKTPMKSFRGSPLLNSNMLQTLFPTSIPLIRTNLALYLLYDFFLSSVFFPLTPLFRGRHFLATNIQITSLLFILPPPFPHHPLLRPLPSAFRSSPRPPY